MDRNSDFNSTLSSLSDIGSISKINLDVKYFDEIFKDKITEMKCLYVYTIDVANDIFKTKNYNQKYFTPKSKSPSAFIRNDTLISNIPNIDENAYYENQIKECSLRIKELEQENTNLLRLKDTPASPAKNEFSENAEELETKHQETIESMKQFHKDECANLLAEFNMKLEKLDIQYKDCLRNTDVKHKELIEKITSEHQSSYGKFVDKTNAVLKKMDLKNQHLKEIINKRVSTPSQVPDNNDYTSNLEESVQNEHMVENCLEIKCDKKNLKLIELDTDEKKNLICLNDKCFQFSGDTQLEYNGWNVTLTQENDEISEIVVEVLDDTETESLKKKIDNMKQSQFDDKDENCDNISQTSSIYLNIK